MWIATGLILVLSCHLAGAELFIMGKLEKGLFDVEVACKRQKAECVSFGRPDEGGLDYVLVNGTEREAIAFRNDVDADIFHKCAPMRPEVHSVDEIDQSAGLENKSVAWSLDRIDQRLGLDGMYKPEDKLNPGGAGVHVYVFDTGIRTTHKDFEGRAWPYIEVLDGKVKACKKDDVKCASDGYGHGTHVAGTIGGKTYGVAKNVTLMSVKVLQARKGNLCNIIPAMDWVMRHHPGEKGQKHAIMSMSLGADAKAASGGPPSSGGPAEVMDYAVKKAVEKGFLVTVAAGNVGNQDNLYRDGKACSVSPAKAKYAITVGGTTRPRGTVRGDEQARWSNGGKCVDIWAPGESIMSTSHQSDERFTVMSGTSMATPAVAGALALLWNQRAGFSNKDVHERIGRIATRNVVKVRDQSNPFSRFLYVGTLGQDYPPQPTPLPGLPAPTPKPPPTRRRVGQRRRSGSRRRRSADNNDDDDDAPTTTTTTPWREPPTSPADNNDDDDEAPTTTTTTPWREPPTDLPTKPPTRPPTGPPQDCCKTLRWRLVNLELQLGKLRHLPKVVYDLQERVKKLEMGSGPSPGRRRRRRIVKPTRPPVQPTPAPTPRPRPTRPPFTRRRRLVVPRRRRSPVVDRRRRRTPPVKTTTTTTSYHREFRPE